MAQSNLLEPAYRLLPESVQGLTPDGSYVTFRQVRVCHIDQLKQLSSLLIVVPAIRVH